LTAGSGRDGDDPTRIDWVANEGIRVSRLVRFIAEARLGQPQRALRAGLLDAKRPPLESDDGPPAPAPTTTADTPRPTTTVAAPRLSDGAVTVTIPLSITVRLGEMATHPGAAIEIGAAVGALERIDPDPDYANRPGYDPDFLGFPVPLPRLTNTTRALAARLDGAEDSSIITTAWW
jgi:endonuclease G